MNFQSQQFGFNFFLIGLFAKHPINSYIGKALHIVSTFWYDVTGILFALLENETIVKLQSRTVRMLV